MHTINIIGLGYIGLPTALSLASKDIHVIGTDYNEKVVNTLKSGNVTFEENGLEELFNIAIQKGITFTTKYQKADIYIIAVPTPYIKETKKIDASYVQEAVKNVLEVAENGSIIVIESTVSPGTIDNMIRPIIEKSYHEKKVHLVHAPERILPGNMLHELENNSRTIGCDNESIGNVIKDLYASFCKAEIVITDIKTAEMSKVIENTYRDINIAFANELTKICHMGNMDVYKIIDIANRHPRVNILSPGPGVGGHCISVDPWFLVGDYPELTQIISAARRINDSMPEYVLKRVREIMNERKLEDLSRIGFYGLTYKENVDDVRESPTLQLLESMENHLACGAKVYDPYVSNDMVKNQYHNLSEFLANIDFIVIMVGHDEIKNAEELLKEKIVLDTRNIMQGKNIYKL